MSPKFRTSTGRLTAYSFWCGYIETKEKNNVETRIYHDSIYHVIQMDRNPKTYGRVFWESFDTLAEARNCFNRQKGRLTSKRVSNEQISA